MVQFKTVCHFIMLAIFFSFGKISQTQIAFISDRDWNSEIYVMDPNGNNLRRLTNHPAHDGQPSWSPDGRKIVFVPGRGGGGNMEVYVMNSNGDNMRNLTNNIVYGVTRVTGKTALVNQVKILSFKSGLCTN